ncbi:MAG: hypothetical protein Aurels2KO_25980 [Aureliella sp.]
MLTASLAAVSICAVAPTTRAQDADEKAAEVAADDEVGGDDEAHDDEGGHDSDGAQASHDGDDHGDSHSGDHASHDTDPTHANMSDAGASLVEFRTDMAFFSAVVFLLLMAGLFVFAWKPIMEGLAKREKRIAGNIQKAEQDAAAAEAKLAEYSAKLAAANEEAQELVATARKDAEATGQKIVAAAQEEAVAQQKRAADEIESAKRVALNELAGQSTNLAMSVAGRVVGREVNAGDHNTLIEEMLSKLPSNN